MINILKGIDLRIDYGFPWWGDCFDQFVWCTYQPRLKGKFKLIVPIPTNPIQGDVLTQEMINQALRPLLDGPSFPPEPDYSLLRDISIRERDRFMASLEPHTATETGQTIVQHPFILGTEYEYRGDDCYGR